MGVISYDRAADDMTCSCGNTSSTDGFVSVNEETLQDCEPSTADGWTGLYMCQTCGATINPFRSQGVNLITKEQREENARGLEQLRAEMERSRCPECQCSSYQHFEGCRRARG